MIIKQDESRRAYVFGPIDGEVDLAAGMKVIGDSVRFSKSEWKTERDCEDYLREKTGDEVLHVKSLAVTTKAIDLDDAEWSAMTAYMTNPENVKRESFRVYRSWLANNVIDRDRERFPLDMLRQFAATLPGKSKMLNHNWYDGEPEGRYYAAEIVEVSQSEMLSMVGNVPVKNFAALVAKAKEIDGGLYWLVGRYYVPADDKELIFKIDSGIYAFESIGFRAPAIDSVQDENGEILWDEWKSTSTRTGEATEGSWVFLGSQYGARTGKSAAPRNQAMNVDDIEELIESLFAKHFKQPEPKIEETGEMIKLKIAEAEYEINAADAESAKAMVAEIEAKLASADEQAKTLRDEIAALKKVLDAAGVETEEQAAVVANDAKTYRESVIDETIKYGQLTGAVPTDEDGAKAHRETLAKLQTEEIKGLGDGYRKSWEKANPPQGQIKPDEGKGAKEPEFDNAPNAAIKGVPF